jgi:hypothetical protein
MKAVYKDPITERIQKVVYDADIMGRRIDYIEVTVREANELSKETWRRLWMDASRDLLQYTAADAGKVVGIFCGTEIRIGPSL